MPLTTITRTSVAFSINEAEAPAAGLTVAGSGQYVVAPSSWQWGQLIKALRTHDETLAAVVHALNKLIEAHNDEDGVRAKAIEALTQVVQELAARASKPDTMHQIAVEVADTAAEFMRYWRADGVAGFSSEIRNERWREMGDGLYAILDRYRHVRFGRQLEADYGQRKREVDGRDGPAAAGAAGDGGGGDGDRGRAGGAGEGRGSADTNADEAGAGARSAA